MESPLLQDILVEHISISAQNPSKANKDFRRLRHSSIHNSLQNLGGEVIFYNEIFTKFFFATSFYVIFKRIKLMSHTHFTQLNELEYIYVL